jgi:hypothetical protein
VEGNFTQFFTRVHFLKLSCRFFPAELKIGPYGGGYRRGSHRQAKAFKYFPYRLRRIDRAQYPHPAAAMIAAQNVHAEYSFHQLGPGVISRTLTVPIASLLLRSVMYCRFPASMHRGFISLRYDITSPPGRRGQHPMVANQIESWRRHQGRKFPDKVQRSENHLRRSVAPSMPQPVQYPAVRQPRQALRGYRRPACVAAEVFQLTPGSGRNPYRRMQAESGQYGAAPAFPLPDPESFQTIAYNQSGNDMKELNTPRTAKLLQVQNPIFL